MACGAWRLDQEIGRGAYGVVYLAAGAGGERAAVKVCRREDIGDERFERELRGAKLYRAIPPQEGLVRMRELVETEWGFYTVMDLADDEFASDGAASSGRAASPFAAASGVYRPKTLARVIEGEKALPLKESISLALSLAKGLDVLQRHHLLHRDIKPANVLYVKGLPVLSDPGLLVEESDAASLVGTPGYVPPESFTEAASDIYSLGLTLKAASFGRQVEELDKGPSMEADTGAALFPAWWRILNKATDPTPSRRYQSAKALIKDLKALRLRTEIASKFGSRAALVIVFAAAVTVVAFMGYLVVSNDRMSDEVSKQKKEIARQAKEITGQIEARSLLTGNETNLVSELQSLRQFKTDTENMMAKSERETLWPIYASIWNFDRYPEKRVGAKRKGIAEIAVTNKTCAAELQAQLDRLLELDKQTCDLVRQISALREKAKEKIKNGQDDGDEYRQAKELYNKRIGISKECKSIFNKLPSSSHVPPSYDVPRLLKDVED